MKTTLITAAAFVASSNALIASRGSCCFELSATTPSGSGGTVGQIADGQNRLYGGLEAATYCISEGGLTDQNGRGCIFTPPTTQFQCDTGATPEEGFTISCEGTLSFEGNSDFVACPTGDNGEYNIYTTAPSGQGGCYDITLTASSCASECPTSTTSVAPTPTPTETSCPENLNGEYQFPHLIIPISESSPDTAYGTQYNGTITPEISTIFNFDIPSSYSGETCSLIFLLPEHDQLVTSAYSLSGSGAIDFSLLNGVATESTDYANAPGVETDYGVTTVAPGGSYTIATFSCPAGKTVSYELESSGGTSLSYFQDYNAAAIGLYITSC